ncbi:hypothetical protein CH373_05030 [Leptospira perolatii]|uniref:Major facilitator superfamily (MFS) profile domain-containing protein n=1 Tax=Leptospira perolatii TaxID=2023191 RepID=A0A2M9ZQH9_9LEPT|nr:MFS transporter [Leptospira perolatii]PJZ70439.1 hypothetical protein CH360_05450 [Leptospira perolatii]PJZ74275.1 hypothetical protein CH373_05030 [Leptospira perolatii]
MELTYTSKERRSVIVATCLGWLFDGMDIMLLVIMQKQIQMSLNASDFQINLALGLTLLFTAIGGILFSPLGDKIGRKKALSYSILIYSLGTAACAFSPNIWTLIVLRIVSAIGIGGEWALGYALLSESYKPKRRGLVGGAVHSMYGIGALIAVILGTRSGLDWRWVFGLAALPALMIFWIRRAVPESKVWLALQEEKATGKLDPELHASVDRAPLAEIFKGQYFRITLLITFLSVLSQFCYYAVIQKVPDFLQTEISSGGVGLDQKATTLPMLLVILTAVPAIILSGFASDRFGRKKVFAIISLYGLISLGSFAYVAKQLLNDDRLRSVVSLQYLIDRSDLSDVTTTGRYSQGALTDNTVNQQNKKGFLNVKVEDPESKLSEFEGKVVLLSGKLSLANGTSGTHSILVKSAEEYPRGSTFRNFVFAFLLLGISFGYFGIIGVMFSEFYPTHLRATGPGFAFNLGRGMTVFSAFFTSAIAGSWGWPYAFASCGILFVINALLVLLLPNVTGREISAAENEIFLEAAQTES